MPNHVMLDIETMGKGPKATILSIGAVKFNPNGVPGDVTDSFHVAITMESCARHGLTLDVDTVEWWLNPERRTAWDALSSLPKVDLWEALEGFSQWVGPGSLPVWGNGAAFDNVIVRSAYVATDQPCPWAFWDDRCYRTLKALAPAIKLERLGVHHGALDDALSQAKHLQTITQYLGLDV